MKKSYYFAAMDECLSVLVDAINQHRNLAADYRTSDVYLDAETGKPKDWANKSAVEHDALADEMEKILHVKFGV